MPSQRLVLSGFSVDVTSMIRMRVVPWVDFTGSFTGILLTDLLVETKWRRFPFFYDGIFESTLKTSEYTP